MPNNGGCPSPGKSLELAGLAVAMAPFACARPAVDAGQRRQLDLAAGPEVAWILRISGVRKKELKRIDTDVKVKKHGKKKRAGGPKGIVDVLNCPPLSHFHYELVVGNGIGDDAVEDALAAFERAWEVRRQKAYEAATQDGEQATHDCVISERLVLGPFSSKQDWKIDWDAEPMTAMTWCWVGYESIRFCKPTV